MLLGKQALPVGIGTGAGDNSSVAAGALLVDAGMLLAAAFVALGAARSVGRAVEVAMEQEVEVGVQQAQAFGLVSLA